MNAQDPIRKSCSKLPRDTSAPVTAVRPELFVSEGIHQADPEFCGTSNVGAFGWLAGEAEAWDRGNDDVERVVGLASPGRRITQRSDRWQHLPDRARPPVRHEEWNGRWVLTALMYEMKMLSRDGRGVVVEGIEVRLVRSPVVFISPVGDQFFEKRAVRAIGPWLTG